MDGRSEMLATIDRIAGRTRRGADVRQLIAALRDRVAGTPERREASLRALKFGGPAVLILLAVVAYFIFRPTPQPNYRTANLQKVFNYTLLTDEFNRLPIEKRLELIGQLVQRLKGMSAGESALMAAFAAGIAGKAREQIEENASRLAVDLWDKYAQDYATRLGGAGEADRAAFFDQTYLEFVRTMEAVAGEVSDKSDAERLAEVRRQAQRDVENMRSGRFNPPGRALGRMFTIMRDNVGGHASPAQQARGMLLMRDMVRHFRGTGGGR